MIGHILAVAKKDILIEYRAKVALNEVVPFALAVLLLFGFALDTQAKVLVEIAPGVFWVVVLFSSLYLISRSLRLERDNGAIDGLALLGIDPIAIFFGKLLALFVAMTVLEVAAAAGIFVLFSANLGSLLLVTVSAVAATIGIGSVGLVYGALASSEQVGESLLPLLVLPLLAPIVIAATKCWSDASGGHGGIYDPWLKLVVVFSVVFLAVGAVSFGAALED